MATALMHRGLESAAKRFPDHPAVLAGEDHWSFAQLDRAANAAAQHLIERGIGPGQRVAVMASNRPEFVVTVTAIGKAGAAPVLLNPSWKQVEVATAVALTDPCYAVGDGDGVDLLARSLGANRVLDLDGPGADVLRNRASTTSPPRVDTKGSDDSVLVFSSGTTDLPKAVRHTHASMARS